MTDRELPVFGRRRTVPRRLRNGFLTLAEANRAIGYGTDAGQVVRLENGETAVATIAEIVEYGPWRARREALLGRLSSGA